MKRFDRISAFWYQKRICEETSGHENRSEDHSGHLGSRLVPFALVL
jgi:hypothetical protein